VGSLELAHQVNAVIYHGRALYFKYGEAVREGDSFDFGSLILKVLETPGHTPESISLAVMDKNYSDKAAAAVFTGDTLFIGDTGRIDLYPERKQEMAGKLYDSIHKILLPLGDQAIIYPAHSKGLAYASNISSREFSTLGYERAYSPALQKNRKEFIKSKLKEAYYYAPYFRKMEHFNQDGIILVEKLPEPEPVNAKNFASLISYKEMFVLDIRSPEAFAGGHISGSLNIHLAILSAYAGWFLPYDQTIGLIAEQDSDIEKARIFLMRFGYDNISCYLAGGIRAWVTAEKPIESIPTTDVNKLHNHIKEKESFMILDVRGNNDYCDLPSLQSRRIWIGELPEKINNLPLDKKIITLCSNGQCAATAASILKQHFGASPDIEIFLGTISIHTALLQDQGKQIQSGLHQ